MPKSDHRIEAYGTIDELNSVIGFARAALDAVSIRELAALNSDLETLQHWLFDLGSLLAANSEDRAKFHLSPIGLDQIKWLEGRIDQSTAVLKPLKEFILPAGSEASTRLHIARTVARRAERRMTELADELPENAIPFINRISDYLFVMARLCNHFLKNGDVVWKKSHL